VKPKKLIFGDQIAQICQDSVLQVADSSSRLPDVVFDPSESTGWMNFDFFILHDELGNKCSLNNLEVRIFSNRDLPVWLNITFERAKSKVIWSASEAPATFSDTITFTIFASILR